MIDKKRTRLLSDYYGESLDAEEVLPELKDVKYIKKSERDAEEGEEDEDGEEDAAE